MTTSLTIPRSVDTADARDFYFLREQGLKYIEELASKLWTDYNSHDPGITILEVLAYAITDLGYRTALPIEHLVAEENNNLQSMHEKFSSAINILPACPLSVLDYRKIFINIDVINNAWLFKADQIMYSDCKKSEIAYSKPDHDKYKKVCLDGLYKVVVDLKNKVEYTESLSAPLAWIDEAEENWTETEKDFIENLIKSEYHQNRNLCEDLLEVCWVEEQPVQVCADIELDPMADAEDVYARIILAIEDYFSPPVPFYSLKELLDEGLTSDQIFEGPVLKSEDGYNGGFVKDEDLINAELKCEVRLSDLINIIMDIPGILKINKILINLCNDNDTVSVDNNIWKLPIAANHKPIICDKSNFNFYKDVIPVFLDQDEADQKLKDLRVQNQTKKPTDDLPMPLGQFYDLSDYTSIQNDLPDTYGVNQIGLSSTVSDERKAEAKQLKGYLLFFDQILSNYFAHLSQVKDLFLADNSIGRTYFSQQVEDAKDVDELYKDAANISTKVADIMESLDDYFNRKNDLLDHLLARFSVNFNEYVLLMHSLSGKKANDDILEDKVQFLKDFEELSCRRATAFNYCGPADTIWDTPNVSGLSQRIVRFSGMSSFFRRNLGEVVNHSLYSTPSGKFRFEVFDQNDDSIFKANRNYDTEEEAMKGCKRCLTVSRDQDNFDFKKGGNDSWGFSISDPEDLVSNVPRVLARSRNFPLKRDAEAAVEAFSARARNENNEGLYIFEHLLLRPIFDINKARQWATAGQDDQGQPYTLPAITQEDLFSICTTSDCEQCDPIEPYSFRISVVVPGWTSRTANMDFRRFLEKTIRLETPAHILPKICFIGRDQMEQLETAYQEWLTALNTNCATPGFPGWYNDKLIPLLNILNNLENIYPSGTLHDCENETAGTSIILGRSNIGSIEQDDLYNKKR